LRDELDLHPAVGHAAQDAVCHILNLGQSVLDDQRLHALFAERGRQFV
jgi:hypothetical protein